MVDVTTPNKKQKANETDVETLIKEQVEYYFSDSNFRRDKWMNVTSAENDGFIPIEKLLDFKKLASILNDNEKDLDFLTSSILKSDLLSFSEDNKMVKRKFPLPETDDSKERTVVVSGLPTDSTKTTIETVKAFFGEFGIVLSVNLQKNANKELTGACYVEFKSADDAKKASESELKFEDSALSLKLKTVFDEERKALREEKSKKEKSSKKKDITKGVILRINSVPFEGQEAIDIRKFFSELYGNVKFVDTNSGKGENKIYVRFGDTESVEKVVKAIEAKECKNNDKEVEGALLEGEEEETY